MQIFFFPVNLVDVFAWFSAVTYFWVLIYVLLLIVICVFFFPFFHSFFHIYIYLG